MTREPNPRDDRVGQASVEALQHVVDAITISEYVTGDDACIETSPQRFAGSVCVMSCFRVQRCGVGCSAVGRRTRVFL